MKCKICSGNAVPFFSHLVLRKHMVEFYRCGECRFIFTEEPYWLEEAYKSPINYSDTGLLQRNILFSRKAAVLLYFFFDRHAKYLDYAGGYGVFTRLMRDIGFDFYWYDPFCQNIFAKKFEDGMNSGQRFELLTSFESFEHFVNPVDELKKMMQYSDSILFSTELIPDSISKLEDWWYFGFEHGQHISFYSPRSLTKLAASFSLNYTKFGTLHLFSKKKFSKALLNLAFYSEKYLGRILIGKFMKSKTVSDHQKLSGDI